MMCIFLGGCVRDFKIPNYSIPAAYMKPFIPVFVRLQDSKLHKFSQVQIRGLRN